MISELKKEEEKYNHEKKLREEELEKEKRKKEEIKKRKDNEKKNRLEKQKMLGLRWGMLRWVTQYIKENEEDWEKELNKKIEKERKELEDWDKAKRFEKIEILKKKWRSESKIQINESQQNLSISEPSEYKSQRNLSTSESGVTEKKSQRNLPHDNIIKNTSDKNNKESNWTVWTKKTNNTNNKNNNITNISEDPTYEDEESYKIKPKILKSKIYLGGKITSVDSIEELDDKNTESDLLLALEVLENKEIRSESNGEDNTQTGHLQEDNLQDKKIEDNLRGHLNKDNHLDQDHPSKDSLSNNDNPDLPDNRRGHLSKDNHQGQDHPSKDSLSNND